MFFLLQIQVSSPPQSAAKGSFILTHLWEQFILNRFDINKHLCWSNLCLWGFCEEINVITSPPGAEMAQNPPSELVWPLTLQAANLFIAAVG